MSTDNLIRFPTERTTAARQAQAWLVFEAARREWREDLHKALEQKAREERSCPTP